MKTRKQMRHKRTLAIRRKVLGSLLRPRLSVFRSNTQMSVQFIDDEHAKTLGALSAKGKNHAAAVALGKEVVEFAKKKNITSVVFDRSGYRYHGAVETLANTVREGGIIV